MSNSTGGDLLSGLLEHLGVEAAFGVVSVHNLPLVDAIHRHLRWVPTRGEAGAVGAADGYARVSGGFGCAITSTGTGAGNAAGALVEALAAGTPVLHVTGQIDSEYLGQGRGVIHETPASSTCWPRVQCSQQPSAMMLLPRSRQQPHGRFSIHVAR